MPYQVQQIIEGKGMPVCITKDEPVSKALALMIEHDYSQLPVVKKESDYDRVPEGMITHEGILRGVRNFNAKVEDLKVRDVMTSAPIYNIEDDLFDILDRLKETNAVLIVHSWAPDLMGIVTSYDTAEYFRDRTEDLMRVEDIELMVKEFIKSAYFDQNGELNEDKLNSAVAQVTSYKKQSEKQLSFADLTLADYISLLFFKDTWVVVELVFGVQKTFVSELLNGVREIRNALAHFRGNISAEQRDKLKFGAEWLTRCYEEYQAKLERERIERKLARFDAQKESLATIEVTPTATSSTSSSPTDFLLIEAPTGEGRYAPLADWLQSQPGGIDEVKLSFEKIEEIIGGPLPNSAYEHRAWWANDSQEHPQSKLWLEVGWRTNYLNRTEKQVTFVRIHEREKAYIEFFSKLLAELREKADFPIKQISADGTNWVVCQTITSPGLVVAQFNYSFARGKRFRVELYIDTSNKETTKQAFDRIYVQRSALENVLGELSWERIDEKRASRIAVYHAGAITDDDEQLTALRGWAVEKMIALYKTLEPVASKELLEVLK